LFNTCICFFNLAKRHVCLSSSPFILPCNLSSSIFLFHFAFLLSLFFFAFSSFLPRVLIKLCPILLILLPMFAALICSYVIVGMLHVQNFYVESTSSSSPMHKTIDPSQFCIDGSYYIKNSGTVSSNSKASNFEFCVI